MKPSSSEPSHSIQAFFGAFGVGAGMAKRSSLALCACFLVSGGLPSLRAAVIDLPNASFQSPATAFVDTRVDSWQKTPKPFWYDESGGFFWDQLTGVFKNSEPGKPDHIDKLDGDQAIYLFAVPSVGFFQDYDSTDWAHAAPGHEFAAAFETGKSYTLTVGVVGGGGGMVEGSSLLLSLYYRDAAGQMVTVGANPVTYSQALFPTSTHLVDMQVRVPAVQSTDAWAGKHLGVMVVSTAAADKAGGYWDLDNIRLAASVDNGLVLKFARSGEDLRIAWPSVAGFVYQVKVSEDLKTWSDFGSPTVGTGGEIEKLAPLAGSARSFFAVTAVPAP